MLLESIKEKRLRTDNFKRVSSRAIRSIDFDSKSKTLEIEFIDGEVYHYYKVPARFWKQILQIIETGESLGTFINQDFKAEVKRLDLNYRRIMA